jgi:peptidoglycan/xylan/chitin deacetylase (PgdA/CDA1 family)
MALMQHLRRNFIRAGLEALYFSGAHRWLRPLLSGVGAIFMLHHVRPAAGGAFQPNGHLEVTPEFLRATLEHVRKLGIDIVTMDEMHRRLTEQDFSRRFVCFTLDDGYRDNRDYALSVFREFDAPSTTYIVSDFADGTGRLWWVALEQIIARSSLIQIEFGDGPQRIDCVSLEQKFAAFANLHKYLRKLPSTELRTAMRELCDRAGIDESAICRSLCMSWLELQSFAKDPLVTIGAHTESHCNLAQVDDETAEREMAASRDRITKELGLTVRHFAYPYGGTNAAGTREFNTAKRLGFATAVTTRPGMLFPDNAAQLTSLPRLSLNGHFQYERLLPVLTSGAATAVWNRFHRNDAA